MIITNSRLILLKFLIINLFLLETTGFDFYSHSTIHYFFNEQITHSYALFDSLIILPRYGLLSSLYEFSSRLGLPLGYLALALIYPPVNVILNFIFKNKIFGTISVKDMGLIFFVCYLVLFYSGLSLSALYILAYLVSMNKLFLVGTFFHPISIFICPILFFFILKKREFLNYLTLFFAFLLYCFLLTKYELQTSFKSEIIKLYIEKDVFFELVEYSYNQKSDQINLLLCFLLISFFFRNKAKSIFVVLSKLSTLPICRIKHINVALFFFIFSFTIIFTYKGRPNFYNSLFVSNDVMYVSWLDFGQKEYIESFEKLNSIR